MSGSGRSAARAVLLTLAFTYLQVGLVLTDYGAVWAQPEEFEWREYILQDGLAPARGDLVKGLNWRVFEYEPRSTRPLSHYFEMADTKVRAALWRFMLPHPSLSLTWILLLAVTPLLFFRLLRNLGVPLLVAGITTAVYVGNPGTLSLAAVDFRPAKALANFAIVCALHWASRIQLARDAGANASFYALCAFMALSLLFDETAVFSLVAVATLFPAVAFGSPRRAFPFLALPAIGYLTAFRGVPALTAWAGFELPRLEAYGPGAAVTEVSSIRRFVVNPDVLRDLPTNAVTFASDLFGLVNPTLAPSWTYRVLWTGAVVSLAALFGTVAVAARRSGWRNVLRSEVWLSFGLLLAATFFANLMLHLVANRLWGLHWLNTYWPIFALILLALLLKPVDLSPWIAGATACTLVAASVYDFRSVNHAMKTFFYYRTVAVESVLAHTVNRFTLPQSSGSALRERTRAIWRGRRYATSLTAIPSELYYLVHDLRMIEPGTTHSRQGTLFDGSVATFDLVRDRRPESGLFVLRPSRWARPVWPP